MLNKENSIPINSTVQYNTIDARTGDISTNFATKKFDNYATMLDNYLTLQPSVNCCNNPELKVTITNLITELKTTNNDYFMEKKFINRNKNKINITNHSANNLQEENKNIEQKLLSQKNYLL